MTILALEFSSSQRSVAVAHGASISEVIETGIGKMDVFGMIEQALRATGVEREQIETIAVGLGPGSYTGIRTAIAMAEGWNLGRHVQLKGVGSAEAIAWQARVENVLGTVGVVVDAQRGEIYLGRYHISATELKEAAPLTILPPGEVEPQSVGQFVGPESPRWFPSGKVTFPRAAGVARLAAEGRCVGTKDARLEPIYLREPVFVKAPSVRRIV
ncbi:MAG: tRNA (adenosine(37)-N6)-threonylcarbamoyltransferase complex dimerization subunit type 1 TsaB [Verrucomicrobia bacterium]|nr:tRNA (adenosine(37)-N6)-threonylcarbamoyltransferase complex dimerization subunit type 1 TsaB [Verrucomicrobiota bacterium]MDE3098934.1 tRNA (adenosine(37)-N6)-threonylcarbamoyltransferase complex dimerization subunit type 1 TsaB [Verrucomicrobiota bacterium]